MSWGLAETFLQQGREVEVPGYDWYGYNRIRDKRAKWQSVWLMEAEHQV